MPQGWNKTTIVLIPKVENLERLTKYRMVSLCNVIYRLIQGVGQSLENLVVRHYFSHVVGFCSCAYDDGQCVCLNNIVL
jgi:hypothetical protein